MTAASNGGYIVVPASLTNKVALLAAINNANTANPHGLPSNGGTPLSETLVDVGRYLSGTSQLGSSTQGLGPSATPYPVYNRNMTTGGTTGTVPPSPVDSECEKIFVIVVTDGLPTSDTHDHQRQRAFTDTIGPYRRRRRRLHRRRRGHAARHRSAPERAGHPERGHLHGRLHARHAAARRTRPIEATASTTPSNDATALGNALTDRGQRHPAAQHDAHGRERARQPHRVRQRVLHGVLPARRSPVALAGPPRGVHGERVTAGHRRRQPAGDRPGDRPVLRAAQPALGPGRDADH